MGLAFLDGPWELTARLTSGDKPQSFQTLTARLMKPCPPEIIYGIPGCVLGETDAEIGALFEAHRIHKTHLAFIESENHG